MHASGASITHGSNAMRAIAQIFRDHRQNSIEGFAGFEPETILIDRSRLMNARCLNLHLIRDCVCALSSLLFIVQRITRGCVLRKNGSASRSAAQRTRRARLFRTPPPPRAAAFPPPFLPPATRKKLAIMHA